MVIQYDMRSCQSYKDSATDKIMGDNKIQCLDKREPKVQKEGQVIDVDDFKVDQGNQTLEKLGQEIKEHFIKTLSSSSQPYGMKVENRGDSRPCQELYTRLFKEILTTAN